MRDLTTCEERGTEIRNKRTGRVVGYIVGTAVGGFTVFAYSTADVALLRFEDVDQFEAVD